MPVAVPTKIDREDIEKYVKRLTELGTPPDRLKVDRQDFSSNVTALSPPPTPVRINDEDIWTKMRAAAAVMP